MKSANDEILVLRDQSGGATKALSKEKKRLEEVEDNLQRSLTAGRQRETALKSTIEGKEEEIAKLERYSIKFGHVHVKTQAIGRENFGHEQF